MFRIFDIVELLEDIPSEGLNKENKGTVIFIFNQPTLAYEVEFCDSKGRALSQVTVLPHQICKI